MFVGTLAQHSVCIHGICNMFVYQEDNMFTGRTSSIMIHTENGIIQAQKDET